jgi:hypothetical protein
MRNAKFDSVCKGIVFLSIHLLWTIIMEPEELTLMKF